MRGLKKYVLLFAATFIAVALLLAVPELLRSGVCSVQAVRLVSGDLKSTVSCSGTVTPVNTQIISYGYALKVKDTAVRVGDKVQTGDTLMTVDQDATRTALTANQTQDTVSASSDDQSQLNALASQYGFGSQSASSVAGSTPGAASTVSDSNASGTDSRASLSAGAAQAVSDIPSAVKAGISGIVTQLNVQSGSFSTPRAVLAVISNISKLQVVAQVDENMIDGVRLGQTAYISGVGFANRYVGKVTQIYPAAQQISVSGDTKNVVTVAVSIDNPSGELKPNLSANVEIVISDNKKALAVPYAAVCQDENDTEYVYVCRSGKAVRTNITTGMEYDNDVQVLKGLKEGDKIIVSPPEKLGNGSPVRIVSVGAGGSKK